MLIPGAVRLSAKTGEGIAELHARIAEQLQKTYAPVTFVLPFDRFGLVGQIRPLGRVINEEYTDTGLELTVVLANADRDRLVSKYGKEILKGEVRSPNKHAGIVCKRHQLNRERKLQFMQKAKVWENVKEYALLTLGTVIMTIGIYFFKFPNHFSTGGVSGMAVVLSHYIPNFTNGDFVMLINVLLLIVGYIVLGKGFGGRTTYVSLLMSGLTWGLERIIPMNAPMTSQPLMELIFAVSLPAVGSAILFNLDASSGGTDIVAMILRKYTSLNIGRALMCSDLIITLMACVAFGMETGLFCILGLVIKSLLVDMVLENINTHKYFHIITTKPREIEQYITNVLKRGATELHGEGAYTHEGRTVLMTVMKRHEAIMLRKYVKMVDPHAFVLIMNTGEIIGKGFRGTN